jgi:predicted lipoprotein
MQADDNLQKHLTHPFYKDAKDYIDKTRIGQIIKGAHKYPEPFTTSSWTSEEIIAHAMQENVDQGHYIYAAHERMQRLETDLREAEQLIKWLDSQLLKSKEKIRELRVLDRVSKNLQLQEENLKLAQEIARLKDDKELYQKLFIKQQLKE